MPTQNPKHIRRQVVYTRQHEYKSAPVHLKYFLMGGIAIVVITAVVLLAIYLPKVNPHNNDDDIIIETGDWVKMEYELWADTDEDGLIDYKKETPFDTSYDIPGDVWQVQVKTANFPILGWYNKILGMKNGTSKFITINAAVDDDQDGIDDITGQPVLTLKEGEHAYQKLLVWVKIVEIIKEEDWNPNLGGINLSINAILTTIPKFSQAQLIKISNSKK